MLLEISGQHFMAYRERFTLPLANQGTVLIKGDNRISNAADSNGVGKTSIGSAIAFAAYGLSLKDKRADDVACRFTKDPCLTQLVGIQPRTEAHWKVLRGRRPKRLEVYEDLGSGWRRLLEDQDDAVIQQWINGQIGYSFKTFRNAIVFDRFEQFMGLEQAEQLRLLDEIQGINFRHGLEMAKAWRGSCAETLSTVDQRMSGLMETAQRLETQIDEFEEAKQSWQAEMAQASREREEQLVRIRERQREINTQIQQIEKAKDDLAQLNKLIVKVKAATEVARESDEAVRLTQQAVATAERGADDLEQRVEELIKLKVCGTCRQPIKGNAVVSGFADEIRAFGEQVGNARLEREKALRIRDRDRKVVEKLLTGRTLKGLEGEQEELQDHASETALKTLTSELEKSREQQLELQKARSSAGQQTWPMEGSLRQAKKQYNQTDTALTAAQKEKDTAERFVKLAEYWVEAFGDRGIRSLLFDQVGSFLTERVLEHLEDLAAGEAKVLVSSLSALKSGGMKERLSITTEWDWGGAGDQGSSGQDARVALAMFGGIQDVAEKWAALPFSLKFFDEPGDSLDQRGKELFLEWIAKQAKKHGTACLVTHDVLLAGMVDADVTWNVVLDRDGSHIEVS